MLYQIFRIQAFAVPTIFWHSVLAGIGALIARIRRKKSTRTRTYTSPPHQARGGGLEAMPPNGPLAFTMN